MKGKKLIFKNQRRGMKGDDTWLLGSMPKSDHAMTNKWKCDDGKLSKDAAWSEV